MLGVIPTVRTYIYESLFSWVYSTLLARDSCPTLFMVTLDLCRALSGTTQELTCGGIVQAQPLEVCMSCTQSLRLAGEKAGRWNGVGEWGEHML